MLPTTFNDFGLQKEVVDALNSMGFEKPTPVQASAIPVILENKDLIALAHTGSGKTAACSIPICSRIDVTQKNIQALIIVPTRELAFQYAVETQKIGKFKKVQTFAIYGGESADLQQSKLRHGVHVLIATPGRLIDFIYSRSIDLRSVQTLILDEADEMLSMGFYDDLVFVMNCLVHEHQTLLFSATMPTQIKEIAIAHMRDPVQINENKQQASPTTIDHLFLYCQNRHRNDKLIEQMIEQNPDQAIIFCHSRLQVEKVHRALSDRLDGVDYLHAGLAQNLRSSVIQKFRKKKVRFLVATDVASRGLDFAGVSHVFIYQLSDDPDLFIHRSGRTGRCERAGKVVTLVTDYELSKLQNVLRKLKKDPQWIGEPPPKRSRRSGSA